MSRAIQLYLASTSPRRRELLQQLGLVFDTLSVDVNEKMKENEHARDFVSRMALEKARAGWQCAQRMQSIPVLGSDTVVVVDEDIFGKPRDRQHAVDMLTRLSDRCHQVITAVALVHGQEEDVRVSNSQVCFRPLSMDEINAYWKTGEPQDKAGAYAIQGIAAQFICHLQGSYSAVMGLPLFETAELLSEFAVQYLLPTKN
jgi:septum formation protein